MKETFIPRKSEHLAQVDYDDDTQTLTITFQDGRSYEYDSVPVTIFQGIQNAPSAGSYFHRQIKNSYVGTEV